MLILPPSYHDCVEIPYHVVQPGIQHYLIHNTRGNPVSSSSITATSRFSICSTTFTGRIGVQSEGLLAVMPVLALVVIFLLMRLRKLRQRQDESTRLKPLIRREPSNVVSPTWDAFSPGNPPFLNLRLRDFQHLSRQLLRTIQLPIELTNSDCCRTLDYSTSVGLLRPCRARRR